MTVRSLAAFGLCWLASSTLTPAFADPPEEALEVGREEGLEEERAAIEREREELRQERAQLRDELRALREQLSRSHDEIVLGNERVGFGSVVTVHKGEQVEEVVSFGQDVEVAGHVLGDAVSFGGDVRIDETGRIDGDAVSFGGRVDLAPGGLILGDRVAMNVPGGIPVRMAEATPDHAAASGVGSLTLATDAAELFRSLYRRAVWLLSIAGAGVLVVGVFPQRVTRVAEDLEIRPVRAAIVGALAVGFLTSFSVLFGVVTLGIGLPVSLVLLALLGVAWLLGFVGLCQAVGDRLPLRERPHGRWLAFLIGVVLLTFFGSLPWVGWLVVGAASTVGVGAALSTRLGSA